MNEGATIDERFFDGQPWGVPVLDVSTLSVFQLATLDQVCIMVLFAG